MLHGQKAPLNGKEVFAPPSLLVTIDVIGGFLSVSVPHAFSVSVYRTVP